MESLHKINSNVIFTIAVSIICFVLLQQSATLVGEGMVSIILNWLPFIIGIGTLVCYFIARAIKKEAGWIVTAMGAIFNIVILISVIKGT